MLADVFLVFFVTVLLSLGLLCAHFLRFCLCIELHGRGFLSGVLAAPFLSFFLAYLLGELLVYGCDDS